MKVMEIQEKIKEISEKVQNTIAEQRTVIEEKVKSTLDQLQVSYPTQFETINAYSERISGKVSKQFSGFNKEELVTDVKEELNIIITDIKNAVDKGLENLKTLVSK
jgi:hypothetical protein